MSNTDTRERPDLTNEMVDEAATEMRRRLDAEEDREKLRKAAGWSGPLPEQARIGSAEWLAASESRNLLREISDLAAEVERLIEEQRSAGLPTSSLKDQAGRLRMAEFLCRVSEPIIPAADEAPLRAFLNCAVPEMHRQLGKVDGIYTTEEQLAAAQRLLDALGGPP